MVSSQFACWQCYSLMTFIKLCGVTRTLPHYFKELPDWTLDRSQMKA